MLLILSRAFGKGEVSKGFPEKALPTGMGTMLKANRGAARRHHHWRLFAYLVR